MKKVLVFVVGLFLFFSCSKESEDTMYVKGSIKGLKKGTLYLQKQVDSLIVSVDSIYLSGVSDFLLTTIIESPEVYYLTLGKTNKKIAFFGEKDSITINSRLNKFEIKAEITGSENQDILDEYYEFKAKFSNQNLDLIKEQLEARKSQNQDSILIVENKINSLYKRRYLYAINYVINHANFEAAPYITLTELYDANTKMLDTMNNSLTSKIKESKYGKQLEEYIIKRKGE
ncbi:MAG: DUF4369 domain-containing protein [Flavobacteriaceae bacterium]|nr:DUF4369 domain-containing protein [Flavobacteriaceae bacterium]